MYWIRFCAITLAAILLVANGPAIAQEEAMQEEAMQEEAVQQEEVVQEETVDPLQMAYEEAVAIHDDGDWELAVKRYKEILKQDKTHAATHANMGLAYMSLDKRDDAINAYKKAIEYNTEDGDVLYNLGTLYHEKGKHDDAIKTFEAMLMQSSDEEDVDLYTKLYLNLGNAHFKKKHYDQAIEAYQEVTRIDSVNAEPYFNMAIVYAKQKDADGVIASLQMYIDKAAGTEDTDQIQMWLAQLRAASETTDEDN
ncbi:MAG: tetratricopeptide repeat protein [Gemmatimonadota bacterium]|nr:tetratricopeptide repeat protein [Gemmatimonadota bacterium]